MSRAEFIRRVNRAIPWLRRLTRAYWAAVLAGLVAVIIWQAVRGR